VAELEVPGETGLFFIHIVYTSQTNDVCSALLITQMKMLKLSKMLY